MNTKQLLQIQITLSVLFHSTVSIFQFNGNFGESVLFSQQSAYFCIVCDLFHRVFRFFISLFGISSFVLFFIFLTVFVTFIIIVHCTKMNFITFANVIALEIQFHHKKCNSFKFNIQFMRAQLSIIDQF